jgi:hypothetical protein
MSSAACPNCNETSCNQDVDYSYCGDCGYHYASLGIPDISTKFRQPSPVMQLRAEYSSIDGNFLNWAEGIISLPQLKERLGRRKERINEILEHIEKTGKANSW